jgi:hypothetical protein
MRDDTIYDIDDELVLDEQPVAQVDDFRDTDPMGVPSFRAQTSSEWPPAPPLPADLAAGTITKGVPPQRHARSYAIVRRPTTSSGTDD